MNPPQAFGFNELEQWLDERRVTAFGCAVPDPAGVAWRKTTPEKFTEDCCMRRPKVATVYAVIKDCEPAEFLQVISPLQREHLLLTV